MRCFSKIFKGIGITVVSFLILFIVLDICCPLKPNIEYGQLILTRDSAVLHAYLTTDEQWRMKARLDEITPELEKAIIYKEDKYFYYHPGVNVFAIGRAFVNNLLKRRRTSGASTITMQVARMLSPKKRTYVNKLIEIFRAFQLELHHSKSEILQLYLNLVPYGSNIQGVKAASILYFDKMPDQLSLAEITALSIIPNRPNSMVIGKNNSRIAKERNKWLLHFKKEKLFADDIINDALNEPLDAYRHDAPKKTPQFAYRVLSQYPQQAEVITTLNARMQNTAEGIVSTYMNTLRLNNIHNAAVIIIDNETHEIISYIGSPDFYDEQHNGQVDGVSAARSPGSTLKPILYGLSVDKGIITPKTMIPDVPINFAGYAPENYDLAFHGNVTAEDALRYSLNIPAVKLLEEVGVEQFITALAKGGISTIWDDKNNLGLSMILGGCTIRLDELTNFYSAIANQGKYYPLSFNANTIIDSLVSQQILSPSSAFIISDIITALHRPDIPNLSDNAANIPKIAWKTGTSYGRKDAWSIGYNKHYTIGVWVGNFDGTGVPELNGAGTATPLLFQLFNSVDKHASEQWLVAPAAIQSRNVCAVTGNVPNDYCTEEVLDYFIPGVSTYDQCEHLREVWLSPDEQFSYCTTCLPASGYKTKSYPNTSAELAAYYDMMHISYTKVPTHNPSCTRLFEGDPPSIISLTDNSTYIIVDKEQQQLQLLSTAANDVKRVYWYINDKFYTSTKVGEKAFFTPLSPRIKISCSDDKGRNTDINIKVKFI